MILILKHSRLPIIEFPWAVLVVEIDPSNKKAFRESYVFLLSNARIVKDESYALYIRSPDGKVLPIGTDTMLLQDARNYAERIADDWQREEYTSLEAMHLHSPVHYVEADERYLLHLWLSGIANEQIRNMRTKTRSRHLGALLDSIMCVQPFEVDKNPYPPEQGDSAH